ncbi:MAG TPA: tetratricopeptide repeat protein, partial [Flavobacteriaceae bacterium]|nr:tetratricopeptide repeat protein [Flavobacteriaceae bacterium]
MSQTEIDAIKDKIDFDISFAQNNIDNNEFYKAQDDLEQALELAKQINDNKSIGLIYSKMGKLYYIQENPEEATKILVKAIEKQRFAKDNINIAETYKTLGLVYLKQKKE